MNRMFLPDSDQTIEPKKTKKTEKRVHRINVFTLIKAIRFLIPSLMTLN